MGGTEDAMERAQDLSFAPNCWIAPEFDPIKMIRELQMQLNGRGGHIDQTHLYLDPLSAACWCALAEQEGYSAARAEMPLDRAAAQVCRSTGDAGLDVIGLGCGDAKEEVRLARHLGEVRADLRLYLLDISQPLLSVAFKHAADSLSDVRSLQVFAIQGDFHHLPRYAPLLSPPGRPQRRHVACMFGNTFANLHNEILFVRNSLLALQPGDLFLLNVPLALAPADRPDEIMARDPRLSGKLPRSPREAGGMCAAGVIGTSQDCKLFRR
jgi:SAM-dependent methyltransferase